MDPKIEVCLSEGKYILTPATVCLVATPGFTDAVTGSEQQRPWGLRQINLRGNYDFLRDPEAIFNRSCPARLFYARQERKVPATTESHDDGHCCRDEIAEAIVTVDWCELAPKYLNRATLMRLILGDWGNTIVVIPERHDGQPDLQHVVAFTRHHFQTTYLRQRRQSDANFVDISDVPDRGAAGNEEFNQWWEHWGARAYTKVLMVDGRPTIDRVECGCVDSSKDEVTSADLFRPHLVVG